MRAEEGQQTGDNGAGEAAWSSLTRPGVHMLLERMWRPQVPKCNLFFQVADLF